MPPPIGAQKLVQRDHTEVLEGHPTEPLKATGPQRTSTQDILSRKYTPKTYLKVSVFRFGILEVFKFFSVSDKIDPERTPERSVRSGRW